MYKRYHISVFLCLTYSSQYDSSQLHMCCSDGVISFSFIAVHTHTHTHTHPFIHSFDFEILLFSRIRRTSKFLGNKRCQRNKAVSKSMTIHRIKILHAGSRRYDITKRKFKVVLVFNNARFNQVRLNKTLQRLIQNCAWVSPVEEWVSSGLCRGRGSGCSRPGYGISPLGGGRH